MTSGEGAPALWCHSNLQSHMKTLLLVLSRGLAGKTELHSSVHLQTTWTMQKCQKLQCRKVRLFRRPCH
jgi:hypothetical protein